MLQTARSIYLLLFWNCPKQITLSSSKILSSQGFSSLLVSNNHIFPTAQILKIRVISTSSLISYVQAICKHHYFHFQSLPRSDHNDLSMRPILCLHPRLKFPLSTCHHYYISSFILVMFSPKACMLQKERSFMWCLLCCPHLERVGHTGGPQIGLINERIFCKSPILI
jgi:hypothetical protein